MYSIRAAILYLALLFSLPSRSEPLETAKEVLASPTTFAVCKTIDVATTIHLLSLPGFHEANPLVAWSMQVGGYVPLIAVSVGLYFLLKESNNPTATSIANIATCGVAAHNLLLLP